MCDLTEAIEQQNFERDLHLQQNKDRRERIATAVLGGLIASGGAYFDSVGNSRRYERDEFAAVSLWHADALIKKLDE